MNKDQNQDAVSVQFVSRNGSLVCQYSQKDADQKIKNREFIVPSTIISRSKKIILEYAVQRAKIELCNGHIVEDERFDNDRPSYVQWPFFVIKIISPHTLLIGKMERVGEDRNAGYNILKLLYPFEAESKFEHKFVRGFASAMMGGIAFGPGYSLDSHILSLIKQRLATMYNEKISSGRSADRLAADLNPKL